MKRESRNDVWWAIWAVVAAFGTYFCMYAFRKPFTAAGYEGILTHWSVSFKSVLVSSQVTGYMLAKFIGIKVIAEMPPQRRAASIAVLILLAEASLVGFGLAPPLVGAGFLFLNGLSLGMVFGLVLGFLEGRQVTESLTAGLCASFILADGVMKSVGSWLLAQNVPEPWMPSLAGAIFLLPLALFVAMLARIPQPNAADVVARTERVPMFLADRRALLGRYGVGLALLVTMYLAVTIMRSFRADFAPEIWTALGATAKSATFTQSEILVALGVLVASGLTMFIRNNRRAFMASLALCAAGFVLVALALAARQFESGLEPFSFMVLIGLGLYLPYVAVHTTVFERLLAMTGERGNIGFLMYVADSIGYLGYVAVMLTPRNAIADASDFLGFFFTICWITVGVSIASIALAGTYFASSLSKSDPLSLSAESVK